MHKQLIYRAAVIPYFIEDGTIKMMFMVPSDTTYGGSAPQIAKGRIEEGESAEETARREGYEELGLKEDNILSFDELGVFLGRTTFYVAKIRNEFDFDVPHFETKETRWMTLDEFAVEGRDIHQSVVNTAVNLIELSEGMI